MWPELVRLWRQDAAAVEASLPMVVLSNRGFHALVAYRLAHALHHRQVPLVPLVLSRIIQVLYGIDIDYRARLGGGIVIVHGVGTVIGQGVVMEGETKIYHGVTLGIAERSKGDGFPHVARDVILGAGAKVLGPVHVGEGARVGANAVVLRDVPAYHVASGVPAVSRARKKG
ncbi:Serine O-acetyltransferase [Deinococcus geothermalis DSM 11300]|uniref:Serine acetyltransferase n=1 Tax=Deinococcus geothermalis (strain DSM 11300 / CIP 105573 / AG-3a) TaxID=319795 RepID=Q1J1I3_DEIGD|nr:serine O-acetyltransferase [Deinococcus geothermalis]ABF44651.1 Serine O-acetyltransferase [Deinococcus geothermalis DSM 11300]